MSNARFQTPRRQGARDVSPDILRLAARRVPRYTSYPTALQFTPGIGAETYRAWLAGLTPGTALSLYLHVPFCRHLCFYCGCHTRAERSGSVIETYADSLRAEIGMVAAALPETTPVVQIHWGGGTPTELGVRGLARTLDALGEAFRLEPGLEHAVELDPRRLDRDLVRALASLGVTRASLGVQTFDGAVQAAIGRVQPFGQVSDAVEWLRAAGIEAINFDLMYGLPRQSVASVAGTARAAAGLRPQRISAFGYAHVPWAKRIQGGIDEAALPGTGERLAQMEAIRDTLVDCGYVAIGFDHFALPDDPLAIVARDRALRRNFQGYTTDAAAALIGFGASAIGRLPSGYVQNAADLRAYQAAVSEGRLPVARGVAVTEDDRRRASLIEDLLCGGAVRLDHVPEAIRRPALARLAPLVPPGLVTIEGDEVRLTDAGWPFARLAASAFDAYLPEDPRGHSLAI